MSKKVFEFTVGDAKSNQQTASKLDCQIIVNNNNKTGKGKRKVSVNDEVQVFDGSESIDTIEEVSVEADSGKLPLAQQRSVSSLSVNVPVHRAVENVQTSSNRFYITARNPAVLREEICQSLEVKNELLRIYSKLLLHNDPALAANILDRSGKIILPVEDLASVIAIILSSSGNDVKKEDVKITYRDEYITSCLKVRVSPFKTICGIAIGDQDLKIHQYEAYNCLTNDFNISAETVFYPMFDENGKLIKA